MQWAISIHKNLLSILFHFPHLTTDLASLVIKNIDMRLIEHNKQGELFSDVSWFDFDILWVFHCHFFQ